MKVLFDYGAGGDKEWSPPTFKDCAAADISAAFLNTDEHAEERTVIYDGVTYKDIPVIEIKPKEGKRSSVVQMQHDFGQGLYKRSINLLFCPRRWVVERLFGWLDKFRRLWKNCQRKLLISAQILTFALIAILIRRF